MAYTSETDELTSSRLYFLDLLKDVNPGILPKLEDADTIDDIDPREIAISTAEMIQRIRDQAEGGREGRGPKGNFAKPDASNNFGYISKPGALSLASKVPGGIGLMAKAVNLAVNENNVRATNRARQYMGLDPLSKGQVLGGLVNGTKGKVADVVIGDKVYAVGFEALTKDKRTTLTPEEARKRSLTLDAPITPATKEQVEKAEKQAPGKKGGLLGRAWRAITQQPPSITNEPKPVEAVTKEPNVAAPITPVERESLPSVEEQQENTQPEYSPPGAYNPDEQANVDAALGNVPTPGDKPATAPEAAERQVQPGLGLANLTPAARQQDEDISNPYGRAIASTENLTGTVGTSGLAGKGRYGTPDTNMLNGIQQAVESTLGPGYSATLTSGTYSPEQRAAIDNARTQAYNDAIQAGASPAAAQMAANEAGRKAGQIGSTRHTTGLAADFSVVDPYGNTVTDEKTLGEVAKGLAAAGFTGIGYDPGYMGAAIHADMANIDAPAAWGAKGTALGMDPNLRTDIMDNMNSVRTQRSVLSMSPENLPTPTPRDQAIAGISPMSQINNQLMGPDVTNVDTIDPASPSGFFGSMYSAARNLGFNDIQAGLAASQASLESGYGKVAPGENYFGIKASPSYTGPTQQFTTTEYAENTPTTMTDSFRAYTGPEQSLRDYGNVMSTNFDKAWSANSIDEAASGLNTGRYGSYATDPSYAGKIGSIANKNIDAARAQYDQAQKGLATAALAPTAGVENRSFSMSNQPQQGFAPSIGTSLSQQSLNSLSSVPGDLASPERAQASIAGLSPMGSIGNLGLGPESAVSKDKSTDKTEAEKGDSLGNDGTTGANTGDKGDTGSAGSSGGGENTGAGNSIGGGGLAGAAASSGGSSSTGASAGSSSGASAGNSSNSGGQNDSRGR